MNWPRHDDVSGPAERMTEIAPPRHTVERHQPCRGQRLGLSGSLIISIVAKNKVKREAPLTGVLTAHHLDEILELHDLFHNR